jgi:methanogenic corrinoid protein MtbC1
MRAEAKSEYANPTEGAYRRYLEALLAGERIVCRNTVDDVLEKNRSIRDLYENLFRRSLYEVGEQWECGRISVADEHLATAMTESLLTRVYPHLFEVPRTSHSAIVSCIANEYHQIGGKMVADTFEMHGWDSYFLGANIPLGELLDMVEKKLPDVVALSVTTYLGMATLLDACKALLTPFPDLEIWVGGQAFNWGGKERLDPFPKVSLINSLSDLETRLMHWESEP